MAGALNNVVAQTHGQSHIMRRHTHFKTQPDGTIKWINTSWKSSVSSTHLVVAPLPGLITKSPTGTGKTRVIFNKSWMGRERFIAGFMHTWGL